MPDVTPRQLRDAADRLAALADAATPGPWVMAPNLSIGGVAVYPYNNLEREVADFCNPPNAALIAALGPEAARLLSRDMRRHASYRQVCEDDPRPDLAAFALRILEITETEGIKK